MGAAHQALATHVLYDSLIVKCSWLVGNGWCSLAKQEALMEWIGRGSSHKDNGLFRTAALSKEDGAMYKLTLLRQINHIKLIVEPRQQVRGSPTEI